ncbi:MAG: methyltransferase domain-containing protein [Gammaproteobacteria bacterium]|nr:methyltransferase domain-containing protein [Gammaproteobacteria bacterium]
MNNSNDSPPTRGWDTYWQGARNSGAYASDGVNHPAVATFWNTALTEVLRHGGSRRILDIATGSGAVVERLIQSTGDGNHEITCVDISAAAIDSVSSRFPGVVGLVADANSIPLDDAAFDLVTSQFGIEYAGPAALSEGTRLLAPGGTLILMMHVRPGIIFEECAAALDAVRRTRNSRFVQRALAFFEAGFAAVRGADRTDYDKAALELNPAIEELESILSDHGEHVAGDTIVRLYSDVREIHGGIQHYEPDEVLRWLRRMDQELAEYEGRMQSMCDSATDANGFAGICERIGAQGLHVDRSEPLMTADRASAIGWVLQATRRDRAT